MPPTRNRTYQRGPHLYRRGATYYARGGSLPRGGVSLHTSDHAEATRRFGELLARERLGPVVEREAPRESPLIDCARAWLAAPLGYTRRTRETHSERVSAVGLWLASHDVTLPSQVTPDVLDAWITERSRTVSRATINRDLRSLRVCLAWCASRGLCVSPPALARPGLREPKREPHRMLPDPAEVARVIGAVESAGYRDALVIYYATGLRYEELQRLAVGDVRDGRLYVQPEQGPAATAEPGKGYRTRVLPLAPQVRDVIVRHLAWRTSKRGETASKTALHRALRLAAVATKTPRFGLHDLRRCFATEAVRRGVALTIVRDWLGHRLTATTERYVGRYRSDAEAVAPVPAMLLEAGAESVLNQGAGISTRGRHLSSVRGPKA
jgi:integrase